MAERKLQAVCNDLRRTAAFFTTSVSVLLPLAIERPQYDDAANGANFLRSFCSCFGSPRLYDMG